MGLFEEFGANKDLQKDGKWVDFDGYKVLIAYAGEGNAQYENVLERKCLPYQKKLARKKVSKETRKKVHEAIVSTYAQTIVLGWEGIKRGSTVLEYSPKMCEAILLELPPFFQEVHDYANELSNFQDAAADDDGDEEEGEEAVTVEGAAEKNS